MILIVSAFVTIFPIKSYPYYLNFDISFFFWLAYPLPIRLTELGVFQDSSKAFIDPEVRNWFTKKRNKACGGEFPMEF